MSLPSYSVWSLGDCSNCVHCNPQALTLSFVSFSSHALALTMMVERSMLFSHPHTVLASSLLSPSATFSYTLILIVPPTRLLRLGVSTTASSSTLAFILPSTLPLVVWIVTTCFYSYMATNAMHGWYRCRTAVPVGFAKHIHIVDAWWIPKSISSNWNSFQRCRAGVDSSSMLGHVEQYN